MRTPQFLWHVAPPCINARDDGLDQPTRCCTQPDDANRHAAALISACGCNPPHDHYMLWMIDTRYTDRHTWSVQTDTSLPKVKMMQYPAHVAYYAIAAVFHHPLTEPRAAG